MHDLHRIAAGSLPMVLVLALFLVGCSPSTVTLHRLVADQERYIGDQIVVTGRVVSFAEPDGTESFVLEDDRQNRVLLRPGSIGVSHVGEVVEVTGRFDFDPERGRILWVEEIHLKERPGGD